MIKHSALVRIALAYCVAATTVAGCNGPQASTVPASESFLDLGASAVAHDQKLGPVGASSEDLVYLSYGSCGFSQCSAEVAVYTFPGGQPIGTWNAAGYALGACSDEAGNVFITYILGSIGEILEFAHGGTTPVATLSDPTGSPVACSVDPLSGNLAVADGVGALLIYRNASGSPTTYSYPGVSFDGVTYDNKGNVFVDGLTGGQSPQFVLAKLPKGGNSFENITVNEQVAGVGELGWDRKYLTIGQSAWYKNEMNLIDRFEIRGTSGRFESATQPRRIRGGVDQYSIVHEQIIIAYSWKPCSAICNDVGTVGIWHYPSGRVRAKHFTPKGLPSTGMALSLAQTIIDNHESPEAMKPYWVERPRVRELDVPYDNLTTIRADAGGKRER